jgi:hypothetical protein
MDEVPKKFWNEWLAAYSKGDEDAMIKKVSALMPAKASGKVWGILNERQKAEQLNSYYMDLADYINEAYISPLMKSKKGKKATRRKV